MKLQFADAPFQIFDNFQAFRGIEALAIFGIAGGPAGNRELGASGVARNRPGHPEPHIGVARAAIGGVKAAHDHAGFTIASPRDEHFAVVRFKV